MASSFNLSGTLNTLRLLHQPSLILPHLTIPTFAHLPIPLTIPPSPDQKPTTIRAIILDKDNCFAAPHSLSIHPSCQSTFSRLKATYPSAALLIVSNTAGTSSDPASAQALALERETGVKVLRHGTKKPGCGPAVLAYLRAHPELRITSPDQIAVVGDRLLTDVMLANMMGAQSVWVRDGVTPKGFFARVEDGLAMWLLRRGYVAPEPRSEFE
ncbi:HAD-superfamily phosphatase [Trichodelitschia bisporula]|uniref:HAD-superfamily phosphatase n=1 Tax=Trichodelitschia bisporula TaxID=703511 RepID=A0A6G1HRD9_9PEZI|nr:HAD-superfamily phosphatase [Trichodelitschia bisporula]